MTPTNTMPQAHCRSKRIGSTRLKPN